MGAKSREKDQNMAAQMKAAHVERQSGRCPTCYGHMPNGTFYPSAADRHIATCKGPARHKGSGGPVKGSLRVRENQTNLTSEKVTEYVDLPKLPKAG